MHDQGPVTPIASVANPNFTTNFTIIFNWKAKGFGCSKVCTYCNWRGSALLPHGPQSQEAVSTFISKCKKSFITISGGGDPLYKFDDNQAALRSMAGTITEHGFKVRIIAREVQHVAKLKGIVDHVSISLDDDVLRRLADHSPQWAGMDVEYSLVLPPLPTENLMTLRPQYAALYKMLGRRLMLHSQVQMTIQKSCVHTRIALEKLLETCLSILVLMSASSVVSAGMTEALKSP